MINIKEFRLESIMDPGLDIICALLLLGIVFYLHQAAKNLFPLARPGWRVILSGFGLLLVGTLIDISEGLASLSEFGLIGNTDTQTLLEKGIVFSGGYLLLLIGLVRWISNIRRLCDKTEARLRAEQTLGQTHENLEIRIAERTAELIQTNAALRKEIIECQQAEAVLREQHTLLSTIIEGATDAIYLVDAQGHYRVVNTSTAKLLGMSAEILLGKHLREVLSPEAASLFLEQNRQVMADGQAQEFEHTTTVEGITQSYSIMKAPYRNAQSQITGVIGIAREITERKSYEAQLEHQVNYDSLTQLPNRILLQNRLQRAIARAKRHNRQLAVLFLDLDRFKMINDSLGHAAGDELLKAVASRLNDCVREEDTVARLSGDEFVIVLENLAQGKCATAVAHKVLKAMDAPFILEKQTCFVATSIGISLYPRDGEDKETLLKNADTALYRAKGQGGKGIQGYTAEMDFPIQECPTLKNDLRYALEQEDEKKAWQGTLLIVDEDEGATACIRQLLHGQDYRILTAHSGWEGLALLACHRIEVVVSAQFMPQMSGTTFLKQVQELYPATTRILLSAHQDRQFFVEAINEGAIYKFMDKSLDSARWQAVIREAFLFHEQQRFQSKADSV